MGAMTRAWRNAALALALGGLGGCSKAQPSGVDEPAVQTRRATPTVVQERAPAGAPAEPLPEPGEPVVLLTDPVVLAALELGGLQAGPMAFGQGSREVSSFGQASRWTSLRRVLEQDIEEAAAADPKAGVGMKHGHRLFDPAWLRSEAVRFELVGVVNRVDRRPFEPQHCGETRLVYRLAYQAEVDHEKVDSRLPMTLNVVYWQDADDCSEAARRWLPPPDLGGTDLARWLRRDDGGALSSGALEPARLKSVEVNLQVVRWPGVMHPSLGGHASYVLRVFEPDGQALVPSPLENTPDVDRLRRDGQARRALLAWLLEPETVAALEQGIAVMPERFAATAAISVTPHGLGRVANRPFSQLFSAADFEALELSQGTHVRSAAAMLRRLDGLSCQGCHESRSVAGFHLLGQARDPARVLDTVFVPISPHLDGDLARRQQFVKALTAGQPVDDSRPLSDFERNAGGYGAHCGLGDPGFADWTCGPGLSCVDLGDPDLGTCLPPQRTAGDPCQLGVLRSQAEPTRDRMRKVKTLTCDADAVCNENRVGFPSGMCTKGCDDLGPGEACGAIVNLTSFNNCIARRQPFPRCIEQAAFEAGMRACDADNACRDDYICARSPNDPDRGVCIPPYFLFQLRVDGHVL